MFQQRRGEQRGVHFARSAFVARLRSEIRAAAGGRSTQSLSERTGLPTGRIPARGDIRTAANSATIERRSGNSSARLRASRFLTRRAVHESHLARRTRVAKLRRRQHHTAQAAPTTDGAESARSCSSLLTGRAVTIGASRALRTLGQRTESGSASPAACGTAADTGDARAELSLCTRSVLHTPGRTK
jgi:hypothetical protein